ncbi:unnamed protein product [Clavelina lepadiformis]|uniref:Uncharacterized protein n=1 Tax=Clavelina lepadiformis TaxID=159417 RepID=A0ABP0GCN3_CLALP
MTLKLLLQCSLLCLTLAFMVANITFADEDVEKQTAKCRGPRVEDWSIIDFKLNVTWKPRKCFSKIKVTYDIETNRKHSIDRPGWKRHNCKVKKRGKMYQCIPDIDLQSSYFYQVCAYAVNKNTNLSTFCTSLEQPITKIDANWETHFSKPNIVLERISPRSADVTIAEPSGLVLCQLNRLSYEMYIVPWKDTWSKNLCKTVSPNVEEYIAKYSNTTDTESGAACRKGQGLRLWTVPDLKPATKYCVFGRFDTDHTLNKNGPSGWAYLQVKTPADKKLLIAIFVPSVAVFLILCGGVTFLSHRRYKKFLDAWGTLPSFTEEIFEGTKWNGDHDAQDDYKESLAEVWSPERQNLLTSRAENSHSEQPPAIQKSSHLDQGRMSDFSLTPCQTVVATSKNGQQSRMKEEDGTGIQQATTESSEKADTSEQTNKINVSDSLSIATSSAPEACIAAVSTDTEQKHTLKNDEECFSESSISEENVQDQSEASDTGQEEESSIADYATAERFGDYQGMTQAEEMFLSGPSSNS